MTRAEIEDWGRENGSYGRCEVCGQKTWIEFGCAALCMGCDYGDEPKPEPDSLSNLGLSEWDFRWRGRLPPGGRMTALKYQRGK